MRRMMKRLAREEAGMTMALTIFMIVIIGVMGAGLLTFVQKDLESVVEVNKGQNAFEMADAGVQAARQQIRRDADPEHYDIDSTADAAYYSGVCNDPGEDATTTDRTPAGENWSYRSPTADVPTPGVTRDVPDSGKFTVTIRWLSRAPAANSGCRAPVVEGSDPAKARFFRVVSTGEFNGAKRKIEAVMSTADNGVAKAYFTQSTMELNGNSCITNISLFALGQIDTGNSGGGSGCRPGGNIVSGTDNAYGNWKNSRNPIARPTTNAGIGSPAGITGGSKTAGRDYDNETIPKFVVEDPADGQMTFPFDPDSQKGAVDAERLAFYKAEATVSHTYSSSQSINDWPADSNYNTVYYVKFTQPNQTLTWSQNGRCSDPDSAKKKGIIVVENGDFKAGGNNDARFSGTVIVRGGAGASGKYTDTGNGCMESYVNSSGTIKVTGNPNPSSNPDVDNTIGYYDVRVWSWRECDEAAAGSC